MTAQPDTHCRPQNMNACYYALITVTCFFFSYNTPAVFTSSLVLRKSDLQIKLWCTWSYLGEVSLKSQSGHFFYCFVLLFFLIFLFCLPPLAGQNEGTISLAEGELLYVIEEDKGDGWTRVRRNEDEEGYVPTSYIEVFLETNAKGAMTYI